MSSSIFPGEGLTVRPGGREEPKLTCSFTLCYTAAMVPAIVPYEEMEHTADVGLRARGRSLEELFANAARGMLWLMGLAGFDLEEGEPVTIEIQGLDREHLLVRWLSEVLYYFREGRALASCHFQNLAQNRLQAQCRLANLPAGFVCRKEIKMVTHHRLRLADSEGLYTCEVIFDV